MKFSNLIGIVIVHLSLPMNIYSADAEKKQIIKQVNICKRNDFQFLKCYCNNFNKIVPMLKYGIPEMNLLSIEPVHFEHIQMDLPETPTLHFQMSLKNYILYGMSLAKAEYCKGNITDDSFQLFIKLNLPKLEITSNFDGKLKFLLLALNAKGDYNATTSGVEVYSRWNGTTYVKNGKKYTNFTVDIEDCKIGTTQIQINNMLEENKEFINNINKLLNANIDLLLVELKPIIIEIIKKVSLNIINNFFATFIFDDLFPKN